MKVLLMGIYEPILEAVLLIQILLNNDLTGTTELQSIFDKPGTGGWGGMSNWPRISESGHLILFGSENAESLSICGSNGGIDSNNLEFLCFPLSDVMLIPRFQIQYSFHSQKPFLLKLQICFSCYFYLVWCSQYFYYLASCF